MTDSSLKNTNCGGVLKNVSLWAIGVIVHRLGKQIVHELAPIAFALQASQVRIPLPVCSHYPILIKAKNTS